MKFKIFNVRIELSFLCVAALTLVLLLDKSGKTALCMLGAFVHECGHILALILCRVNIKSITFRAFDIVISTGREKNFLTDLYVTLSGPFSNLIFALLFYHVYYPFFVSNMVLCLFNLLPLETFDGGHALKLLLSRFFTYKTVNLVLLVLTLMFLVPMLVFGILLLFYSKYNYTLLLIALYLLAILFIK
ncbi:MAG: hypothetical protein IIX27_02975 [Ruminococcus sp.]|nr:hypothetical protein [Ruminococcus sp.]